jgi:hypothetical protein
VNRSHLVQIHWRESYMPVFLERYVLPILVALVVGVCVFNPWKWDWHQRISLFLGVTFLAYFFSYTSHRSKKETPASATGLAIEAPAQVNQEAGDCSANANGDNNSQSVNCDDKAKK